MSAKAHPTVRRPIIVTTPVALGLEGPFVERVHPIIVPTDRDGNAMRSVRSGILPVFSSRGEYMAP